MLKETYLDWDSNFFELPVVRIDIDRKGRAPLPDRLADLRKKRIGLVYIYDHSANENSAEQYPGATAVDRKVTYRGTLNESMTKGKMLTKNIEEKSVFDPEEQAALIDLAIQSGEFSRFNVDPNIPSTKFREMYRTWMLRSLSGELAAAVLVAMSKESGIVGFVTITLQRDYGSIGLIAVAKEARGAGLGKELVNSARQYIRNADRATIEIITQGRNEPACRLYEKTGHSLHEIVDVYHVWLDARRSE